MPLQKPVLSPLWYRALFSAAIAFFFGVVFAGVAISGSAPEPWERPAAAVASVALLLAGLVETGWGLRLRRDDPERRR